MKEESSVRWEEQILVKVREGNNEAATRLYKMNYPAVYHFVIRNHGNEDEAAEIYQQAFVILYEKLQDPIFRLHSSAGTFLYAVSRNLWLASLKEKRRFITEQAEDVFGADSDDSEMVQRVLLQERDFDAMEQSLEILGEPCRTLLKLFYHESLSMEQIAENMGYTNADNAKNQKYKCLLRLRRLFEKKISGRMRVED